jgi:small subunit ribosomal protein S9
MTSILGRCFARAQPVRFMGRGSASVQQCINILQFQSCINNSKYITSIAVSKRALSSSAPAAAADTKKDSASSSDSNNINNNSNSDSASKKKTLDSLGRSYATGRRKTSVARVWLSEGSGQFTVNHRSFVDYFQGPSRDHVLEPFIATATAGRFDVYCTVKGGGFTGQAGALRLGISKAIEIFKPEAHSILRKEGMLTRDARRVERKKAGQKKARKKFQWVKR